MNPSNQGSERKKIENLKQKIRELDAAATKKPWSAEKNHGNYKVVWINKREMYSTLELLPADADFISFARTALPTLLAYCEELEGRVEALRRTSNHNYENVHYDD